MDNATQQALKDLVFNRPLAALGTLRDGGPFVSMVLFAPALDVSAFYILISRLAHHTQDILRDARVSLMIAAAEEEDQDPQTLPRVSIQGVAEEVPADAPERERAAEAYLGRFAQASAYLELGDFSFFAIRPRSVRFVAGFARAFSLTADDLRRHVLEP